jgi:hypothetical protein
MNYAGTPANTVTVKGPFINSPLRDDNANSTRVENLAQLLLAEEILDELDSQGKHTLQHHLLTCQAEAYILANPEILDKPWLRNGGAVHDMISRVKEQQLARAEKVFHSTMARM